MKKRGKPHADFSASLEYLRNNIEAVTPELYAVFESEARQRLRGRDESDWPILATALGLACAVWKMRIFSVLASPCGLQIESRFFSRDEYSRLNLRMNDVGGRRDLSNGATTIICGSTARCRMRSPVAEVPKHEIICLNRYYRTNHIQRICTRSRLVEKDGAKPVRN